MLSRRGSDPVVLNFRPISEGEGRWRMLGMEAMEKNNGFKGVLSDVNEDMEFFEFMRALSASRMFGAAGLKLLFAET